MIDWQRALHELSPMEVAAAIATLVNVWLLVRNNIWTWAWGVVSVVLYGVVFWRSKLWSSTGLQVLYYLPMQAYGWWVWLKAGPTHHDDLPITRLSARGRMLWTLATLPMAALLGGDVVHRRAAIDGRCARDGSQCHGPVPADAQEN